MLGFAAVAAGSAGVGIVARSCVAAVAAADASAGQCVLALCTSPA